MPVDESPTPFGFQMLLPFFGEEEGTLAIEADGGGIVRLAHSTLGDALGGPMAPGAVDGAGRAVDLLAEATPEQTAPTTVRWTLRSPVMEGRWAFSAHRRGVIVSYLVTVRVALAAFEPMPVVCNGARGEFLLPGAEAPGLPGVSAWRHDLEAAELATWGWNGAAGFAVHARDVSVPVDALVVTRGEAGLWRAAHRFENLMPGDRLSGRMDLEMLAHNREASVHGALRRLTERPDPA